MKKILIYICEHAGGSLEGVIGCFEACVFMAVLVRGMAGEDGGDVEYYRGFLECEGILRRGFVSEGIKPSTC